MNITVAGVGYVGLVTGVCLAQMGHHVTCLDICTKKIDMLQTGRSPIYEPELDSLPENNIAHGRLLFTTNQEQAYENAEIIFIAVGTPENPDGTANLSFVHGAAQAIALFCKSDCIVVTKSTVPVGTNDHIQKMIQSQKNRNRHIDIVSNPEFLREGSAIADFFNGDRIIIGANNPIAAARVEKLYQSLNIPIIKTDVRSAEMIKYASNAF